MKEIENGNFRFNNWERDILARNVAVKIVLAFCCLALLLVDIQLLLIVKSNRMFIVIWAINMIWILPVLYVIFISIAQGRILEVNERCMTVCNRKGEIMEVYPWSHLVDISMKETKSDRITVLKFTNGKEIRFAEKKWVLDLIFDNCINVSREEYLHEIEVKQRKEVVIVITISVISFLIYLIMDSLI